MLWEGRVPIILVSLFSLRFNLNTIKLHGFQCCVWWILTIVNTHVTTTTIKKKRAFPLTQRFLKALLVNFHSPYCPTLLTQGNQLFDFYHYELVLIVWESYINRFKQYIIFHIWLLLLHLLFFFFFFFRFSHAVV